MLWKGEGFLQAKAKFAYLNVFRVQAVNYRGKKRLRRIKITGNIGRSGNAIHSKQSRQLIKNMQWTGWRTVEGRDIKKFHSMFEYYGCLSKL